MQEALIQFKEPNSLEMKPERVAPISGSLHISKLLGFFN